MLRPSCRRGSSPVACSFWGRKNVFTQPGSNASFRPSADNIRSTPISRHFQCPSACLKGANRRHRACTPLDSFLSEDLAFTRKGQSEHDFSCWRTLRPPLDAVLAQQMSSLYEQLRIKFYIHQNLPGDDFGVSKIKVKQACLNKPQYSIVRRIGAFAVIEYHHSDTDAFAPIQYIIRSESVRFP